MRLSGRYLLPPYSLSVLLPIAILGISRQIYGTACQIYLVCQVTRRSLGQCFCHRRQLFTHTRS